MVTFTIGGMTVLACHHLTSCCTTACFDRSLHNVIIGAAGTMAAATYWYPKAFGYKLNEFWGASRSGLSRVRVHAAVCAGPDGRPHEPL
jgi:heme/copper-type cytochrome/quinol oxidase subunit 1